MYHQKRGSCPDLLQEERPLLLARDLTEVTLYYKGVRHAYKGRPSREKEAKTAPTAFSASSPPRGTRYQLAVVNLYSWRHMLERCDDEKCLLCCKNCRRDAPPTCAPCCRCAAEVKRLRILENSTFLSVTSAIRPEDEELSEKNRSDNAEIRCRLHRAADLRLQQHRKSNPLIQRFAAPWPAEKQQQAVMTKRIEIKGNVLFAFSGEARAVSVTPKSYPVVDTNSQISPTFQFTFGGKRKAATSLDDLVASAAKKPRLLKESIFNFSS